MKKSVIAMISIIMILIPVMAFASSGGKDTQAQNWNDPTLRVLNYTDLTAANAVGDQGWLWGTFQENNPGITILKEDLFNEPYHDKYKAYAASGNMPDVLFVWPTARSAALHDNKLLKDLTPLINRDGLRSQYSAAALDPASHYAGVVNMIPAGVTASHAFYINTEVLNACGLQPAKTYDELKAQVPILKARGYETIIMANKDSWVMQSCLFSMIVGRFCGADWNERILSGRAKFTDPDFIAALNFVKDLYDSGVIDRSSVGVGYGDGPGMFATNKGAYYVDGDWRAGAFITDQSTGQALISPARQRNIQVSVFPDIAGAKLNKSTSVALGTGFGMSSAIPAGSPREAAAWTLLKWLSGKEWISLQFERGGVPVPSRTDVNMAGMTLEPLQIATANIGSQYTTATAVIDGVLDPSICQVLDDGCQELGLGNGRTPQQIAQDTQAAFDRWRRANPR